MAVVIEVVMFATPTEPPSLKSNEVPATLAVKVILFEEPVTSTIALDPLIKERKEAASVSVVEPVVLLVV